MGGKMSRNKGQRGEREVVKLIQPVVNQVYGMRGLEPPAIERNLMQSRSGGYDIVGLEWLALEVKFQESLSVDQWWQQTIQQAKIGQVPVLIYRKSHIKWKVMMPVSITPACQVRGIVDLDAFLMFLEQRILFSLLDK